MLIKLLTHCHALISLHLTGCYLYDIQLLSTIQLLLQCITLSSIHIMDCTMLAIYMKTCQQVAEYLLQYYPVAPPHLHECILGINIAYLNV